VNHPLAVIDEDIGDHPGGCGLAVGAGHHDRPMRQPGGQLREHPGVDTFGDQAGRGSSPAATQPADTEGCGLGECEAERQPEIGN
jgi:hypothetical protein